jgi:hypothetical protein
VISPSRSAVWRGRRECCGHGSVRSRDHDAGETGAIDRYYLAVLSDEPANIDLAYIGRAIDRLTAEVASPRDDMGVLAAITIQLDGT